VNKIKFFLTSKGIDNAWLRLFALFKYYDVSSAKFSRYLARYLKLTSNFSAHPSFFIVGVVLKKHNHLLKAFNARGAEIAMHGYTHKDYRGLPRETFLKDLKNVTKVFTDCGLRGEGFRYPYLKWNRDALAAQAKNGLAWDSSDTMVWDVLPESENNCHAYQRLINFYGCKNPSEHSVVPNFEKGFIEIPVSLPDDEALVDRLRITDKTKIGDIWVRILEKTYERGEIFTLQLHPERIFLCDKALEMVLSQARQKNPPVWIAQLGEIAKWWKEKDKFEAKVQRVAKNEYRINLSCSDRATILIKNLRFVPFATIRKIRGQPNQIDLSCSDRATILIKNLNPTNAKNAINQNNAGNAGFGSKRSGAENANNEKNAISAKNATNAKDATNLMNAINATNAMNAMNSNSWFGHYRVINQRSFNVKSNRRPVIGLAPDSSPELISFLKQDGYITEVSNKKSDYGIYLEGLSKFFPNQKLEIINIIETSDAPLVRFGRWPNKARSALSITGDIDAITIWDFILRLFGR
jgi:peptidoglycan/xylan/chitin deacetylase (PgdA/CDA1 family)